MEKLNSAEQYELWDRFLDTWSRWRIENMSLDDYCFGNSKSSFCYWLEQETKRLGGIAGGKGSIRFGIYRKVTYKKAEESGNTEIYMGPYEWESKLGTDFCKAFETIREKIIRIIDCVRCGDIKGIESVDLTESVKWKIAFLYQPHRKITDLKVLPFYTRNLLEFVTHTKGLAFYEMYEKAVEIFRESNEDLFVWIDKKWEEYQSLKKE